MNEQAAENDHYIPGICNIGIVEVRRRAIKGWAALMVTAATWALLAYYNASEEWGYIIAIPAAISALFFLESYFRFCARFAMRGLFNFSPELEKTESIYQWEWRKKDQYTAYKIIAYSLVIGAGAGIVVGMV